MEVMIEGKHIKNNSDTLVIVLQGVFSKTNEMYAKSIVNGQIDEESVKNLHNYYHFMKLSQRNDKRDYLYLKDYYSKLYGWYIFDHGKFIYEELSQKIEQLIMENNYKKVYLVGSSKGGAGSILMALHNKFIDKVFAMVPDLRISTDGFGDSGKDLFFNNDKLFEEQVKNIFNNDIIFKDMKYATKKTSFYFFTGVRDYGFKELVNFHRKLNEVLDIHSQLLIMPTPEPHNPLIKNHTKLVTSLIQRLDQDILWNEDEFTSVSDNVHIATYKAIGMQ
ncbi:hypothetical protein [Enterococcus faecium]|uniref:hypothetical protein n=1 Tax=Enterococcus faecium TaxID=1352 RepID=UPI000BF209D2|nr:hypothetical protein [Enterococcus faecium]PEH49702.1 hypothetical protein CRM75_00675 [Enterococcus faecium]